MELEPKNSNKYSLIEKNKIRFYHFLGSGLVVIILTLLLSIIHIKGLYLEYQKKIDQLSGGIIAEKQRFLKNAV